MIIYTRLPAGGTYYPICMFPTNSERLIGISDAFSAFVYGYPSFCTRAHCTPNKSVTTLRYTRRPGPVYIYTGHASRHLPSAVPWISEDRLFIERISMDCDNVIVLKLSGALLGTEEDSVLSTYVPPCSSRF